jgi:hypothetical protein
VAASLVAASLVAASLVAASLVVERLVVARDIQQRQTRTPCMEPWKRLAARALSVDNVVSREGISERGFAVLRHLLVAPKTPNQRLPQRSNISPCLHRGQARATGAREARERLVEAREARVARLVEARVLTLLHRMEAKVARARADIMQHHHLPKCFSPLHGQARVAKARVVVAKGAARAAARVATCMILEREAPIPQVKEKEKEAHILQKEREAHILQKEREAHIPQKEREAHIPQKERALASHHQQQGTTPFFSMIIIKNKMQRMCSTQSRTSRMTGGGDELVSDRIQVAMSAYPRSRSNLGD